MNYKTKQYFINTNSYSSFKVRRPHNPCETDWNHEMFNNVARDFTKCSFHLVLLFSEFYVPRKCHPKNERQKWTNKENWISSSLLAPLQVKLCLTEDRLGWSISLLNRPVRSGLNEFAVDASGLVVVTHGLNVVAYLNNFYTKKSAISYLQTCNINLVFLSLVYSSTNKGKTGKSNTSVVHGLHTSQLILLCPTEIWFVHKCR